MHDPLDPPVVAWPAVLLAAAMTFATQILLGSSLFALTVMCFDVESRLCLFIASAVAFFVGGRLGASVSDGRRLHALFHALLTWTVATSLMLMLATSGTPGPLRLVASGPWAFAPQDPPGVLAFLILCACSTACGAWPRASRR